MGDSGHQGVSNVRQQVQVPIRVTFPKRHQIHDAELRCLPPEPHTVHYVRPSRRVGCVTTHWTVDTRRYRRHGLLASDFGERRLGRPRICGPAMTLYSVSSLHMGSWSLARKIPEK